MTGAQWALLGGVFLGGAFPWLEAIIVIPAGILAGLPAAAVVAAAVTGNLLTVALAAVYGQRARHWWIEWRRRRRPDGDHPATAERRNRRQQRIDRVMTRWGMPGLAILGPLGLGTQISALAAVAVGVHARRAFVWVGAGTLGWSAVAAGLTLTGVSFAGIGA